MEWLYRFCQITQPEIGRLVGGLDYSGVSQARKRLQVRLHREPKLKKRFDKWMIPLPFGLRGFVLPDMDKWQMQYDSYIKALESEGVAIHHFEAPVPYK